MILVMWFVFVSKVIFLLFHVYLLTNLEQDIFPIIVDLFRAGMDTTSHSMSWAMICMLRNPHVQKRCQEEIEKVARYIH